MFDVKIDAINLTLTGAAGQEHRIRPILSLAVQRLAERLEAQGAEVESSERREWSALQVPPIMVEMHRMTEAQVAERVADALWEALLLKLKV